MPEKMSNEKASGENCDAIVISVHSNQLDINVEMLILLNVLYCACSGSPQYVVNAMTVFRLPQAHPSM